MLISRCKNGKNSAVIQLERKLEKLRESLVEAENEDNSFEAKKRKTVANHQRRMTIITRNYGPHNFDISACTFSYRLDCIHNIIHVL